MKAIAVSTFQTEPHSPSLERLLAQGVESRFVDVAGIATHYLCAGLEQPGAPVVLVHGMAMSCEYWERNIPALAAQHPVYALSFWGYGFSGTNPRLGHTLSNYVAFLRRFLLELGLARVTLIGHSMGGQIAARFATDFPAMVECLVLADAAGLKRHESLARIAWGIFRDHDMRDAEYRRLVQRVTSQSRSFRRERDSAVMVLREPIDPLLACINAPTLLIWGGNDGFVPLRYGQAMAQAMPNARLEVIAGASHTAMYHRAEEWNCIVLDFLAEAESPPPSRERVG